MRRFPINPAKPVPATAGPRFTVAVYNLTTLAPIASTTVTGRRAARTLVARHRAACAGLYTDTGCYMVPADR